MATMPGLFSAALTCAGDMAAWGTRLLPRRDPWSPPCRGVRQSGRGEDLAARAATAICDRCEERAERSGPPGDPDSLRDMMAVAGLFGDDPDDGPDDGGGSYDDGGYYDGGW